MVLTTARGLSILTVALFCVLLLYSKDYTAQLFQSEPHSGLKFTNESAHGLFTASPRKHLSPTSTTKFDTKAAPPKVILVAMAVGVSKDSVFWRSLQTHEDYARRWNYRSHILTETLAAEEPWSKFQEFGYSKMLYLQSLVIQEMAKPAKERAEWIVWTDTDALFVNHNVPLELFVPPVNHPDIHVLVTRDWNGLNSGVFFMRIHPWTIKALNTITALPLLRPDIDFRSKGDPLPTLYTDQEAMDWVIKSDGYREHVVFQPRAWYNVYHGNEANDNPGALIIHTPGLGGGTGDALQHWLDRLKREPHTLQLPLKETTYVSQVEVYWHRMTRAKELLHRAMKPKEVAEDNEVRKQRHELQRLMIDNADDERGMDGAMGGLTSAMRAAKAKYQQEGTEG